MIHYLERLHEAWKATKSIAEANQKLLAEMIWPHFWAIQILLTVLVVIYYVMSEVGRTLGEKKTQGDVLWSHARENPCRHTALTA